MATTDTISKQTDSHQLVTRTGVGVRLERLSKRFGDVVAVDAIYLVVQPGEFVSLLGPSGSGKTTTLMMIAGFAETSSGAIFIGGRNVTDLPPNKRDIGVVFQHYALFPHMTVFDNVAFPLRMRRQSKAQIAAAVHDALSLMRLTGFEQRLPRQLSGGQQQRVALARALVFGPQLALMDEPLGALDRQLREQVQLEIKRLQRSLGVTVIYVTHDQGKALALSDRVAVMHQGRIEQFAAPDEVYGRPATAFVATFVGESTFVPGRAVRTIGEELEFATEAGDILRGRPVSAFPVGAAVMGVIRPERLIAVPEPMGSPEASFLNMLTTTCREIMYIGDQTRYEVETATRLRMVLRVQNQPGIPRFTIGDRLQVRWQSEDLRVFAAETFTGLLPVGPLVSDAP